MNWEAVSAVGTMLGVFLPVGIALILWLASNYKNDINRHSDHNVEQIKGIFDTTLTHITREVVDVRQDNIELNERVSELEANQTELENKVSQLSAIAEVKNSHVTEKLSEIMSLLKENQQSIAQLGLLVRSR